MEKASTIGGRLALLIRETGLEQQRVAELMGIKRTTLSGYVTNARKPNPEAMKAIARYFNISVDYLIGYSDIRNPYLTHLSEELRAFVSSPENVVYLELAKDIKAKTVNKEDDKKAGVQTSMPKKKGVNSL